MLPPARTTSARKKLGVVAAAEELGLGAFAAPARIPAVTGILLPWAASPFLKPSGLRGSPKAPAGARPICRMPSLCDHDPLKGVSADVPPDSGMMRPAPLTRIGAVGSPAPP